MNSLTKWIKENTKDVENQLEILNYNKDNLTRCCQVIFVIVVCTMNSGVVRIIERRK